jgi:hypothetical protein
MKRKIFDGTEMVEVEVPDIPGQRRFRLEDVCPPDSECLAALQEERNRRLGFSTDPVANARRVTVRKSAQGELQFASMRREI